MRHWFAGIAITSRIETHYDIYQIIAANALDSPSLSMGR